MRIATRLVLVLGAAVAAVTLAFGLLVLRQRDALLRDTVRHETGVLAELAREPATYLVAVRQAGETRVALAADADTVCLGEALAALARPEAAEAAEAREGWARCGELVHWALLSSPASAVLLARRAGRLETAAAAARLRLLLLVLLLTLTASLVILWGLGRALTRPLARLVEAVRALGRAGAPPRVSLPAEAGELRELGEEIERAAAELEARRVQLAREVEARFEAERQLRELETFAVAGRLSGSLIHELGSPLAVIGMRADAILAEPDGPPAVRAYAAEIAGELERIGELVDGMRRLVRRHELPFGVLALDEVVRAAVADALPQARAAGVELRLRLPEWTVEARGHRALLRHAVFNLLNNAVQALAQHAGERRVDVVVEADHSSVRVRVDDTGPGVAAHEAERLFEPFYTTRPPEQALGLGLVIARSIAQEHGGALHVAPRPGGGARFTLALPPYPPPAYPGR